MEWLIQIFQHPFVWGFSLGLVFFAIALWHNWKTRRELARFRQLLSDKLEVEAEMLGKVKDEQRDLVKENERLRLKIAQMLERPDQSLRRELEVFIRAEKAMNLNAPGFAQAWQAAKDRAGDELGTEERGESLPKKLYRSFFQKNRSLPAQKESN